MKETDLFRAYELMHENSPYSYLFMVHKAQLIYPELYLYG